MREREQRDSWVQGSEVVFLLVLWEEGDNGALGSVSV